MFMKAMLSDTIIGSAETSQGTHTRVPAQSRTLMARLGNIVRVSLPCFVLTTPFLGFSYTIYPDRSISVSQADILAARPDLPEGAPNDGFKAGRVHVNIYGNWVEGGVSQQGFCSAGVLSGEEYSYSDLIAHDYALARSVLLRSATGVRLTPYGERYCLKLLQPDTRIESVDLYVTSNEKGSQPGGGGTYLKAAKLQLLNPYPPETPVDPAKCITSYSDIRFGRLPPGIANVVSQTDVNVSCNKAVTVSIKTNRGESFLDPATGSHIRFSDPADMDCTACRLSIGATMLRGPSVAGRYSWQVPFVVTFE